MAESSDLTYALEPDISAPIRRVHGRFPGMPWAEAILAKSSPSLNMICSSMPCRSQATMCKPLMGDSPGEGHIQKAGRRRSPSSERGDLPTADTFEELLAEVEEDPTCILWG